VTGCYAVCVSIGFVRSKGGHSFLTVSAGYVGTKGIAGTETYSNLRTKKRASTADVDRFIVGPTYSRTGSGCFYICGAHGTTTSGWSGRSKRTTSTDNGWGFGLPGGQIGSMWSYAWRL